ncbi:MAG: T9SS type A sorting domain-containing protein [Bacteroidetes bacterium]|nr:T9SS type A sorting domain-containing protein [Bacteroidota bacterium]
MKYLLLFLSIIFVSISYSQTKNYTISELKGMEDQQGNTNLFYRLYYYSGNNDDFTESNSIYRFNLYSKLDTLFILAAYSHNQNMDFGSYVNGYKIWNSDPAKYIYYGSIPGTETFGFIKRFDVFPNIHGVDWYSSGLDVEISKQNDSLLYASIPQLVKSTDGGRNWYLADSTTNYFLVSLNPFDDKIIYAVDKNGYLAISSDSAKNFVVVDTAKSFVYQVVPSFFFGSDSVHIYRISYAYGNPYLSVSNNKGEANSWSIKYSSTNNIYLSIDYSVSGTIYLADGNRILVSTDYGNTFNVYKTLDSTIVGIYKKPSSDLLYAATKYDIYEISSSSIKSIKHLVTSIDDKGNTVPNEFVLFQNYPNPFNPSTTISYQLSAVSKVSLKVYDVLGREVATLVNEVQSPGEYVKTLHATSLPSGIYLYKLTAGNFVSTKKMIILK